MNQKKTISINKSIPQALIVGLVLGFITVFIVEHYSKVTYNPDTSKLIKEQERQKLKDEKEYQIALKKQVYGEYLTLEDQTAIAMHNKKENDGFAFTSLNIPHDTTVLTIFLETPFDSKLKINGKGYTVGDVWSSYGDFHDYSNKFKYYLKAVLEDFKYVLCFAIGYTLIVGLFMNFKFVYN